jgi:hypothetical protein
LKKIIGADGVKNEEVFSRVEEARNTVLHTGKRLTAK